MAWENLAEEVLEQFAEATSFRNDAVMGMFDVDQVDGQWPEMTGVQFRWFSDEHRKQNPEMYKAAYRRYYHFTVKPDQEKMDRKRKQGIESWARSRAAETPDDKAARLASRREREAAKRRLDGVPEASSLKLPPEEALRRKRERARDYERRKREKARQRDTDNLA